MDILVIGAGYVGTTTAVTFAELGHNVTCIDTDVEKIKSLRRGELYFYEPNLQDALVKHLESFHLQFSDQVTSGIEKNNLIFICVGTPSEANGNADLKYVQSVAQTIGRSMNSPKTIVMKSTVPVGTSVRIQEWISLAQSHPWSFDVVSNPEFLREGCALTDSLHPHRVIIGSNSEAATAILRELYEPMTCPVIVTNPQTAELIKYASNSFLATKISYMNELARLCDVLHIDVRDVAIGIGSDPRIGNQFLDAGLGYGGSCFPKDINALLKTAEHYSINLSILKQVKQVNENQPVYFLRKILNEVGTFNQKAVAVFGFAFKPNTSDTRDSPALSIIRYLGDSGARVNVHDPAAILPTELQNEGVHQCATPEEAAYHADMIVICTDWTEYKAAVDWTQIKLNMQNAYVFDGRNMLNGDYMHSLGFLYHGIGCLP